jgi:hypothetical protein
MMSDESYRRMIARSLFHSDVNMIRRTPQPEIFSQERLIGGKIARKWVQPNINLEPSTLAVTGLHTNNSLRDSMIDEDVLDNPDSKQVLPHLGKPKKKSCRKKRAKGGDILNDGYNLVKSGYNAAKDAAVKYGPHLLQEGVKRYGPMVAEKALEYLPYAVGLGRGGKSTTKKGSKSARGQLVAKLMKEKGLSLDQASKYIKEHQLM